MLSTVPQTMQAVILQPQHMRVRFTRSQDIHYFVLTNECRKAARSQAKLIAPSCTKRERMSPLTDVQQRTQKMKSHSNKKVTTKEPLSMSILDRFCSLLISFDYEGSTGTVQPRTVKNTFLF